MNESEQLKLQAYLDGELTSLERAEVATLLEGSADARQLLAELQHTQAAIRGNESERSLDCSREFYWSRIERELSATTQEAAPTPGISLLQWLRGHVRSVAGVGIAAAAVIVGLVFFPVHAQATESDWEVLHPDTGMVSLRDYQNGITVVMLYDRTTPGFTSGK